MPPAASSLPPRRGGWGALQGSLERRGTLGKGRQIAAGKGALTKVGQISLYLILSVTVSQGGITCGTIDEPRKSSKAIDERVIIDFRDKNVIIARFSDKNGGFLSYR